MSDDRAHLDRMRAANIQQPHLIGDVAEIKAQIERYAAIGVDEFIVPDFTLGDRAQKVATLDRFIREVAGR
jgi:alkanesulfonate monooxygenase SsuD/methylene tetrahydromethanopterin reductase-like flavin-dependent oxidoreductase (luciferase family)